MRVFIAIRLHEGNSGDVDLCECEVYAELNDFNYHTATTEQSQAVSRDNNPRTHMVLYIQCRLF